MFITSSTELKNINYNEIMLIMGYGSAFYPILKTESTELTKKAVQEAINDIMKNATKYNADGIVSLKIELSMFQNNVNVIAYGMAVKIIN